MELTDIEHDDSPDSYLIPSFDSSSNIILEIRAYIRVDVHTTHPQQQATVVIM
jgi:hypothetical protein